MKAAMTFIMVGMVILFLGGIMWALTQFRGADFQEPHIIATAGGVTSKVVVLANPVVDDSTVNIKLVSNNVNDAPVPFSYSSISRQLTINGLNESDTRTLTIDYLVPRLPDFIDLFARFFPAFLIIGCIIAIAGACVAAFRHD
jgi:hypothetical protein